MWEIFLLLILLALIGKGSQRHGASTLLGLAFWIVLAILVLGGC